MATAVEKFECLICKKDYPTKGNLTRHLATPKHINKVRKEKHNEDTTDIQVLREEHRFEIERLKRNFALETQALRDMIDGSRTEAKYWEKMYKELTLFRK